MSCLKIILTIVCALLPFSSASRTCADGKYYDDDKNECVNCTLCSANEVPERKCGGTMNTVCRTLVVLNIPNFSFRSGNKDPIVIGDGNGKINVSNLDQQQDTPLVLNEENDIYWKNLAFALIGLLCSLVILTTAVVVYTCHMFRIVALSSKTGIDENDNEDAENGYVVIHRFRLPILPVTPPSSPEVSLTEHLDRQQRTNRTYRPKRRLMNEYVDDVFESEDSSGSRSHRLPLESIPERNEASL